LSEVPVNHTYQLVYLQTQVFRLLNDPGAHVGTQEFTVADNGTKSDIGDLEVAKSIISRVEPCGVTPLTQHVMEIRHRIESMENELRSKGQKAVIVLATDGMYQK
jgi:hypothetical protein